MPLSIKDPETDMLARKVATAAGESITEAVKTALRERLSVLERGERRKRLIETMRRIGRDCAAEMEPGASSTDHDTLLYDEHGLPR